MGHPAKQLEAGAATRALALVPARHARESSKRGSALYLVHKKETPQKITPMQQLTSFAHLKHNSLEMAGIMASLPLEKGERRRAERQLNCGTHLNYGVEPGSLLMHLNFANFCHQRTCGFCQAIHSGKKRMKIFPAVERVFSENNDIQAIFLTLTVKNCHQSELRTTINQLQTGWSRLSQQGRFPAIGYLKTVEVTRPCDCYYAGIYVGRYGTKMIKKVQNLITNFDRNLWHEFFTEEVHPHIHALLIVHESYFHPQNYLEHKEWVTRWRLAAKLDYSPVVDIRRVYSDDNGGLVGAIFEVSKYCVKPADLKGKLGFFLTRQLHGLKLFSVGGILRDYIKESTINKIDSTGKTGEEIHQSGFPLNLEWSNTNEEYQIVKLAHMEWELA